MTVGHGEPEHTIVWEDKRARVVCLDSMGHVDDRLTCEDVVVAGSHSAVCAVQLLLHLRLRGVIGHAAGPGLDDAGVGGLAVLSGAGVPAAAVSGTSAPIADGVAMYERGQIFRANQSAEAIGIEAGMSAREAAKLMATRRVPPIQVQKVQHVVHEAPDGRVIALDTIAHGDERINRAVICMGSHSGDSMADYVEGYDLQGSITNDAGMPLERSATRGLDRLAQRGIPAAVVSNHSARVGDGRSTYTTGVLSEVNAVAHALGLSPGMAASEAARRMLAARMKR